MMRNDPRRRAMFCMTIEHSTTRIWFRCRSSVIISETFDFTIAEPKNSLNSAAFVSPDKKLLGFDPTIQPAEDNEKQFITIVYSDNDKKNLRMFRTKRIISSYGADPLRG
ncbi:hypothetical protein PILCRDRAFT_597054 [Piloderma croceum F 1598]|uniref:Fungal-type protein kinase domain-containing protein n=1 Tax=Piloderma croceum (strain F 1598) TaxID=765440 RepID=A0A0C3BM48_PILCF|nr:hypothetical protein PILCRDRAFT_597054 [Piloderma croceum F 1598]